MRFTHGLRAILLATIVAIAGISLISAPVTATDPAPSASPDASVPVETASADPAPIASPDPSASPDPAAPVDPAPVDPAAPPTDPGTVVAPSAPVAATTTTAAKPKPKPNRRAKAVRIALALRHRAYVSGGVGPRSFDCSGFVRFVYRRAHISKYLGGGHSAYAMYRWAVRHHRFSRSHPRIGDVVVWGRGKHVGIYIGHGRAISALNPRKDIRITKIHALSSHLTGYIHVRIP